MNIPLIIRTVRYLTLKQVISQVKYRLKKPTFVHLEASAFRMPILLSAPIDKYKCIDGECFSFLNLEHPFAGWIFTENGMLWAYNQNYFDWINQSNYPKDEGLKWIDRFIEDLPNNKIGLDPYPTALRIVNWVKFFCRFPECLTKTRLDSLYSQLRHLEKKLEYHLLGNHLLEDAYALYVGASCFDNQKLMSKAEHLLISQLKEQILSDGAHFEQSPMYHCILLDRLLDCINVRKTDELTDYAVSMLGHLESIIWQDGSIPLLNDAAYGIAPKPVQIFDYAKRLGLVWKKVPMNASGYRKMGSEKMDSILDIGSIAASYQPAHSHADTFTFELQIDGKPIVVDTGISTYNKTERRQLERSTFAHNTVAVKGGNSSEVWGGFRVGRRASVRIIKDKKNSAEAIHNGYRKPCRRRFEMKEDSFRIEDWYDGEAVSYLHLAEGVDVHRVQVEDALGMEIKPWKYSVEYNRFLEGKVLEIRFKGHCCYTIR